jgi:apolipoprotein N-acyltransferase
MFSRVIALWRTRGAFVVYLLGWWALGMLTVFGASIIASVVGNAMLGAVLMVVVAWTLTAVFYVTLWYGFADTFEIRPLDEPTPADVQVGDRLL